MIDFVNKFPESKYNFIQWILIIRAKEKFITNWEKQKTKNKISIEEISNNLSKCTQ